MEILNLVKGPLVVIKLVEKPLVFILQVIITPFATVISKIYVQLLQFKWQISPSHLGSKQKQTKITIYLPLYAEFAIGGKTRSSVSNFWSWYPEVLGFYEYFLELFHFWSPREVMPCGNDWILFFHSKQAMEQSVMIEGKVHYIYLRLYSYIIHYWLGITGTEIKKGSDGPGKIEVEINNSSISVSWLYL